MVDQLKQTASITTGNHYFNWVVGNSVDEPRQGQFCHFLPTH